MHQDNLFRRQLRCVIYQRFSRSVRAKLKALEFAGNPLWWLLGIQDHLVACLRLLQNSRR